MKALTKKMFKLSKMIFFLFFFDDDDNLIYFTVKCIFTLKK